jgi:uncharacterized cupin superfamily protein
VPEAPLHDAGCGLAPAAEGWFVVNVADAAWRTSEAFGSVCRFDTRDATFQQVGVNVRVLEPGKPNCLYHSENQQEAFLVLHGRCRLLVDGEERHLTAWDFFHCPAGVEHVFVGGDDGPCAVLMIGARPETDDEEELLYPVSGLAARYGASAEVATVDPGEAYARFARPEPGRPAAWDQLPWA